MSTYSPAYRTLAFFGFLADVQASATGTHDQVMTTRSAAINTAVEQLCPTKGWSIVWGPTIWWASEYSIPGGDHCWLVAKNNSFDPEDGDGARPVYIMSIAGTNGGLGGYDWKVEDMGVNLVVNADSWLGSWSSGSIQRPTGQTTSDNSTSWIALGAAIGAYTLATFPSNGPHGSQKTLVDYLKGEAIANPKATIIIAGHSLGGALTPVVAMGLSNVVKVKQLAFPMAGPTPGNVQFAKKYAAAFKPISTGQNPVQQINVNFCNTQDIVPMAWNNLDGVKALYSAFVFWLLKAVIWVQVVLKKAIAKKAGVPYTPLDKLTFTGSPLVSVSTFSALMTKNILPQHVTDYLTLFDFPKLLSPEDKMMIGFAAGGLLLGIGTWSVEQEDELAELAELTSIRDEYS